MSDADEIRADIVATRAELAETADALAAKLDVKAQAHQKWDAVGQEKKIAALAAAGALVALMILRRVRKARSN